jgi:hypothetical protein
MGGNFAILNPCPKKWTDLAGDGRVRYCETCKTPVYSIADYSPDEWNRLWHASNGMICAILQTTQVTPLTRRGMLVGALLTAVAPLLAANGRARFRVVDIAGDVLPKATISLVDKERRTIRSMETDNSGEAVWADLPLGNSRFLVEVDGLQSKTLTILIKKATEMKIEVGLNVPPIGTTVDINKRKFKPAKRDGWLIY